MNITRRQFVKAGVASSLISPFSNQLMALPSQSLFDCGIASGDPTSSSVIIWTHTQTPATIQWQVAKDIQFTQIVKNGEGKSSTTHDCTFKVDVQGLEAGETYYYRFISGNHKSELGRTKTIPTHAISKLNFAVASCSNYPFGYFNAYHHIAQDNSIDFVLHLGDYIYEYGQDGWGDDSGKKLNRRHLPANEIISLNDYRVRHRQYKTDHGSRLMHAMHPLIPTWDDHESANNPYIDGAQNHQENEGEWPVRRSASIQAYYEWMPIREPDANHSKAQLWRHFSYGNLATLTTLETRHTGRAKQVNYSEHLPQLSSQQAADNFIQNILNNPSRTMLSVAMEQFLETQLRSSVTNGANWRLIGNQIPMAHTHVPQVDDLTLPNDLANVPAVADHFNYFAALGKYNLPIYLDTWDGYPVAREKFYQLCKSAGSEDLLVLTGDSHAFWANQLYTNNGTSMGVELGTAGITSPGDFETLGANLARELDHRVAIHNKEILWTSCQHRGYIKVSLNTDHALVEYVGMSNTKSEHYQANILRRYQINKQGKSLALKHLA